ncbi:polyprenyl synthetase family protein [Micrococcales bacterium 31B]|nr:polyprenyl synthetase family protein [Micrococcales bacterium 31B]
MAGDSTSPSPAEFTRLVAQCIERYGRARGESLARHDSSAGTLVDAARGQVGHGKFVRPQLVHIAWQGWGGAPATQPSDPAVVAGAAIEFFQAAALIQDDVFDASDTRRGQPATHRRLEVIHRESGWLGRSEHFGEVSAVLASDLCLVWSETLFGTLGLAPDHLARVSFDSMREVVTLGQYLDFLVQADGYDGPSEDAGATPPPGVPDAAVAGFPAHLASPALAAAFTVIRNKTVSYTTVSPLQIGAALAGGGTEIMAECERIGVPLGTAYQLHDDWLGVFGDPATTGKPAGDDIREGKRTAMLALAHAAATPAQRAVLDANVGADALTPEGLAAVRSVLTETRAVEYIERRIADLHLESAAAIAESSINDSGRAQLTHFVERIAGRTK